MKKGTLFIILFFIYAFKINSHQFERKCNKLSQKYGKIAVIITNPSNGKIKFIYHEDLLKYHKYCPGSLIKPFTFLTYAQKNKIYPKRKFACDGFKKYSKDKIAWYGPGHGIINLNQAFAYSCNKFFYHKIIKNKINKIDFQNTLKKFNLETNFRWLNLSEKKFYRLAVGLDAYIQAAPISFLYAYNALFNGGKLYHYNGNLIKRLKLNKKAIKVISEGMRSALIFGTGKDLGRKTGIMDAIVKTGTGAATINGRYSWRHTTAWVVYLSPIINPKISILVLVEKGTGSKEAAEVAAEIINLLR